MFTKMGDIGMDYDVISKLFRFVARDGFCFSNNSFTFNITRKVLFEPFAHDLHMRKRKAQVIFSATC